MSKAIALEWLKAAYSDIIVMENIVTNDIVTHMTAFHSQQSVEKSLKAVMEYYGEDVPWKHDVLMLSQLVEKYISIDNIYILESLNTLYIESRYPGDLGLLPHGKPTLKDAREFYEFATEVFDHVCTTLNIDPQEAKR